VNLLRRWPRSTHALLAAACAAVAALALPPFDLPWLAWVAWIPWFLFIASAPRVGLFAAFLAATFVQLFASMTWVDSLQTGGTVLVALLAVPFALVPAALLSRCARGRPLPCGLLVLGMLTADISREFVLGPSWAGAGSSQWRWLEGLQSAAVFRGHWLSLVVLAVNACVAVVLLRWRESRGRAFFALAFGVGLVWATHLGGKAALREDFALGPQVLGIQPAIPQAIKLRHTSADIWERHREVLAASPAALEDVDILVFPETTFPALRDPDRTLAAMLRRPYRSDEHGTHTYGELLPRGRGQLSILGTVRHVSTSTQVDIADADGNGFGELNVALVVRDGEESLGENPKRCLVPFGEYVPWPKSWPGHGALLELVRDVGGYVPDMSPGKDAPLFAAPTEGRDLFGITICFEVAFPDEFAQLAERGARFVINTSNDAWFTQGAEQELVDIAVRFRAAETRRAVFRVSNAGISTLIDPCGRELARVSHDGKAVDVGGLLKARIPLNDERTPASRFGVLPSCLFPLLFFAWAWQYLRSQRGSEGLA
jgi:apolipoprotein N-acyltransferase